MYTVVDVAVSGGVGSIVLILPEGGGANTDQVGKGLGSVSNRVDSIARAGHPLLVLHGSSAVGSITVRHANWFDSRRLRKAERAAGQPAISADERPSPQDATPQDAPPPKAPPGR